MEQTKIRIIKKEQTADFAKLIKILLIKAAYFTFGLVVSRGIIFEEYGPFGVAFVSAIPYKNMVAGVIGAVFGYFLPSAIQMNIRYIATVITVAAIRWTLNDLNKIRNHSLYAPLLALITMLMTGLVITSAEIATISSFVIIIIEALLASVTAYFFSQTALSLSNGQFMKRADYQAFASVAMTGCIFILSLSVFYIGSVSIGRIFAITAVLFFSYYLGVVGGSISGTAAGIVFSLSSNALSYVSGAYSFGGMMSGILSHLGKGVTGLAFFIASAIVSLQTNDSTVIIMGFYEAIIAFIIFLLIPKNVGSDFVRILTKTDNPRLTQELKNSVVMRLDFAAKAIDSVADLLGTVSKKLAKIGKKEHDEVYTEAVKKTCECCGLRLFCWDCEKNKTLRALEGISKTFEKESTVTKQSFPSNFVNRCCKMDDIIKAVNTCHDQQIAKQSAQRRINEIRGFVSEQFSGLGEVLLELANEFESYEKFDSELAGRISGMLRAEGIIPIQVSCRTDKLGRLSVEIETARTEQKDLQKFTIKRKIERLCHRELGVPSVLENEQRCRILITEKPLFKVQVGIAQHISGGGTLCGDNYTCFNDGLGRLISVISDGMGTGGRAAVDGAMASGIVAKLAKAGLSFDCALKIANSSLLIKSEDESLATLDIACIDLFTGHVEFMKAGAPLSLVRKNGRIIRYNIPSLPIGILPEANFAREQAQLSKGDWIIMFSDGVVATDEKWLETEILNWRHEDTQLFADYLLAQSKSRQQAAHDDDITVIAIQLMQNSD